MVKTENLRFKYNSTEHFTFPDINLDENDDLLILGKSGVGKTTFLHLLAGLLKPEAGNIYINNTVINKLTSNKLDLFRGSNIGLVFQKNYAIQSLSVIENLKTRIHYSKNKVSNTYIDDVLLDLGLQDLKHKKTTALSLGQIQRLSIAMAVIHKPKLILADEPTSSLDDDNCASVLNLLKNQAKKNNSNLIVITHDNRVKTQFSNAITL